MLKKVIGSKWWALQKLLNLGKVIGAVLLATQLHNLCVLFVICIAGRLAVSAWASYRFSPIISIKWLTLGKIRLRLLLQLKTGSSFRYFWSNRKCFFSTPSQTRSLNRKCLWFQQEVPPVTSGSMAHGPNKAGSTKGSVLNKGSVILPFVV